MVRGPVAFSCRVCETEVQQVAAVAAHASMMAGQEAGMLLRVADNKTGYFGVRLANPGRSKPYKAEVWSVRK